METPSQLLQGCVVHAVIISANALLCLALYNRLTAVLARLRAMNQERFDLATRTNAQNAAGRNASDLEPLRGRVRILEQQGGLLYR